MTGRTNLSWLHSIVWRQVRSDQISRIRQGPDLVDPGLWQPFDFCPIPSSFSWILKGDFLERPVIAFM